MRIRTWTVGELNRYINQLFKTDPLVQNLYLEGEISSVKIHGTGNIYFTIKDDIGKVNAIMFRSNVTDIELFQEGNQIVCQASVNLYEKEGNYNLIVKNISLKGKGILYLKFLELKETLKSEGLFDSKYKKEVPLFPRRVGVITSETGAVIHDIINVSRNRFGKAEIILFPAKVQGDLAVQELMDGIDYFNQKNDVDAIILGRGGGAYEELAPFNDEKLARKIFDSQIPIISAVGHETDVTISDFVADKRASTPSMAAEILFPNIDTIYENLEQKCFELQHQYRTQFHGLDVLLRDYKEQLTRYTPGWKLQKERAKNNQYLQEMNYIFSEKMIKMYADLEKNKQQLLALNPLNVLERGYGLVKSKNRIISSTKEIKSQDMIEIQLKDGTIVAEVSEVHILHKQRDFEKK